MRCIRVLFVCSTLGILTRLSFNITDHSQSCKDACLYLKSQPDLEHLVRGKYLFPSGRANTEERKKILIYLLSH